MIIIYIIFTIKNSLCKMGHYLQPVVVHNSFWFNYIKPEGPTLSSIQFWFCWLAQAWTKRHVAGSIPVQCIFVLIFLITDRRVHLSQSYITKLFCFIATSGPLAMSVPRQQHTNPRGRTLRLRTGFAPYLHVRAKFQNQFGVFFKFRH